MTANLPKPAQGSRFILAGCALAFGVLALIAAVTPGLPHRGLVVGVAGAALANAYCIALARRLSVRCPRCQHRFFASFFGGFYYLDPFARRCFHCALPKVELQNNVKQVP